MILLPTVHDQRREQQFIAQVEAFLPFTPNADQRGALKLLAHFVLAASERDILLLRGYAGTGKTNLVSAVTKALPSIRWRSVLLAPTGRAAKVFSLYAQRPAFTIHKKIFRPATDGDGMVRYVLAENLHRNTVFIVDEASMISAGNEGESLSGSLLENLFEYVYSGDNCKLVMVGDTAQLPPVGSDMSPALDAGWLRNAWHLNISEYEMREVARQGAESGILLNATRLRIALHEKTGEVPRLTATRDLIPLQGSDLEDAINENMREYGEENVIIITRSNKHASQYNRSYRNRIKFFEEDLCTGDRLMIVKNNYFWLPENSEETGFIANGDMGEVTRIIKREDRYGFSFCDCQLRFIDYPNLPEQQVKIITSGLYSDNPSLTREELQMLYGGVMADAEGEATKAARAAFVRKNPYYHALQVKFSYAITCHKAQGGQWPAVFIDQGYIKEGKGGTEHLRWLYTALTRATQKVYLVNFDPEMLA